MNKEQTKALFANKNLGTVLLDEPLSKHTSWKIGGPADVFVLPTTIEHLVQIMELTHEHQIPWYVIGKGSNLLVKDGGLRGVVIKLGDQFADLQFEDQKLIAQGGHSFVSAAKHAIRRGFSGLEFATGIPGTVGGAVMMNAGAHGGEVKDVLIECRVLTEEGKIVHLSHDDLNFDYRYSRLKDRPAIVIDAAFKLHPGDTQEMSERVKNWRERRQSTQPLTMPSCGSVFRNPEGSHAGKLIEEAGLKGKRIGGAQISELHGNFIVNTGGATATDVIQLIELVQSTILEKYGYELHPEVRIVGEETP
ncbi:UDP-N-acetylenolpyruvoylglucosamine reductase [Tumebacillus algifaecis]|uniref:UDP-N-acetylenolpyruvoylglucosamine reductase n=1 Tax=Tumebacillus algifaecis TaxID=1214604 RepID=A0A223D394_9BACL|nr:UDP-N-acetylmuramate dehydrogenase [Tumebacillus algifaecis]ASS75867.1 UDP-N-acetylenolpyruvoylglucosamine reductase [Tumebacillus algifaecis]